VSYITKKSDCHEYSKCMDILFPNDMKKVKYLGPKKKNTLQNNMNQEHNIL